jgi:hypothetical protein
MSEPTPILRRALVRAAALTGLGLVVQLLTLPWARPEAFLTFAGVGCTLVGLGVVQFLWAVLRESG